MQQGNLLMYP